MPSGCMRAACSHAAALAGGTWAAVMVVTISKLYRNKGIPWDRKVILARMYAQFITISMLLIMATISPGKEDVQEPEPEREW
jgi:hypothetical protein